MLIIYTGNGQGKTSAAVGMAMRAKGKGMTVLVVQFLKPDKPRSPEMKFLENCGVEVKGFGSKHFIFKAADKADKKRAQNAWDFFVSECENFDVVVLDEINVACGFGLLNVKTISSKLKEISGQTDIILTGRNAPKEFIEIADIATNMEEIKYGGSEKSTWVFGRKYDAI